MKKILLVMMFSLAFATMANAQIIKNTLDSDGNRFITCEKLNVRSFTDKIVTYVNLGYMNNQYYLSFQFDALNPLSIEKGGRVLIRTENGNVLTLTINSSDKDNIGTIETAGNMVLRNYSITTIMFVTKEDIINLSSGVSKFRIEMNNIDLTNGYFEKTYKSDKIGEKVLQDYRAIAKAIKETKKFEDGF